jgi:hypothetical protein
MEPRPKELLDQLREVIRLKHYILYLLDMLFIY